ncbi:hypothetical protein CCR75_009401 [Bremia lactucae]|uniref:Uncharacterized protein n=1 Tax=Bremia lactucae TaxID=4779 RepID=A0A976FI92_BRELC|nr:hypothetical protein CCR75_009401 [Bremia lactucae]
MEPPPKRSRSSQHIHSGSQKTKWQSSSSCTTTARGNVLHMTAKTLSKKSHQLVPDRPVAVSQQTMVEIDRFQQSCELWQKRLIALQNKLEEKVEKVEFNQVDVSLRDIVKSVETESLQYELKETQEQLQWVTWMHHNAALCIKEYSTQRQSLEDFEAVEKQLLYDRIVELETQLAHPQALEGKKESISISSRANQEEMVQSMSTGKGETYVEGPIAFQEARDTLDVTSLAHDSKREENAASIQCNEEWRLETRQLCDKLETSERQRRQQSMEFEAERKDLYEQIQKAEATNANLTVVVKTFNQEREKYKHQKDELKILYTKFSLAMDSVSEKTMRLEELEEELQHALESSRRVETDKKKLEMQVVELQEMTNRQLGEQKQMCEELTSLKRQYEEVQAQLLHQNEVASKFETEVANLKIRNETLEKEHAQRPHQSVGEPSNENDYSPFGRDRVLVKQVAEKEALQMFLLRYYSVAEEKCSLLREKVRELEARNAPV